MAYASGKFAVGLCDRCGFEYKLHSLKKEWNGLKTCRECFEPKHPQLEPHTAPADPQAIYQPRPNTDNELGDGYVVVVYTYIFQPHFMSPDTVGAKFTISKMTGSLGEVTITTT